MKSADNKKYRTEKIYPKVILWSVLFVALVAAVSLFVIYSMPKDVQKVDKKDEETAQSKINIADNSTYKGQISNQYRAYETGNAEYQMATFAPQYKEYVMENFGYADEAEMTEALNEILVQTTTNYEASFGEGYMLLEDIVSETDYTKEQIEELKAEMKTGYGRDFPIEEAKEVKLEILISYGGGVSSMGEQVVANDAAGKSESTVVVAKLENDGWYILK